MPGVLKVLVAHLFEDLLLLDMARVTVEVDGGLEFTGMVHAAPRRLSNLCNGASGEGPVVDEGVQGVGLVCQASYDLEEGCVASVTVDKYESVKAMVGKASADVVNVTDQVLLAKIAVEDQDAYVRRAAVYSLTDHSLLAKIADKDEDPGVRREASARLKKISK